MKVAVFTGKAPHQVEHAKAFREGLRRHGLDAQIEDARTVIECDLAVFWGHRKHDIIRRQRDNGRRYLVMERGYVDDRFQWTSLGYDGLNGRADFCNEDVSGDRWERHFAHHMKPWRKRDGYVLIMGQVRGDAALANVNFPEWVSRTISDLRALGHDVRFRPHPSDAGQRYDCPIQAGSLEDAIAHASFVVTWNSNSGVDAVLSGVPVVAMDEGSMARPVAAHGLESAGIMPDRTRWAHRLAWCQWRMDEISSGAAWDHLKAGMGL